MSETPPSAAAPAAPLSDSDDKLWASLAHFGGILWILPPLLIWLILKARGPKVDVEGKESLNFQITSTIAYVAIFIINAILTAVTLGIWGLIGWILPLAIWVVVLIFCIQGGIKVQNGESYRYPINIRFIK